MNKRMIFGILYVLSFLIVFLVLGYVSYQSNIVQKELCVQNGGVKITHQTKCLINGEIYNMLKTVDGLVVLENKLNNEYNK